MTSVSPGGFPTGLPARLLDRPHQSLTGVRDRDRPRTGRHHSSLRRTNLALRGQRLEGPRQLWCPAVVRVRKLQLVYRKHRIHGPTRAKILTQQIQTKLPSKGIYRDGENKPVFSRAIATASWFGHGNVARVCCVFWFTGVPAGGRWPCVASRSVVAAAFLNPPRLLKPGS